MAARRDDNARQAQLFGTLQQLLAISAVELRPALDAASSLIARPLGADTVDVYLHDPHTDSLVATALPDSPMGMRLRSAGLERLPLATGGLTARVFRTGSSIRTGNAPAEPGGRPDIAEALSSRSAIICRLQIDGKVLGVLRATSSETERFSEADLGFLQTVAHWVRLVVRRAELVERIAREARQEGRRRAADQLRRLTHREQDVAILVGGGLTNDAIAARLVLVPGTGSNHVERILRKLGFSRRTQIASWAAQNGLWMPEAGPTDQSGG